MPVPGPRTQSRPLPGYSNPGTERPTRLNLWKRPGPVIEPGRSPGSMQVSTRGNVLAAGTVRRLWRQTINLIMPQQPYSWTRSAPSPGNPLFRSDVPAVGLTTALRYMTRSVYGAAGTDNTRLSEYHTTITPRVRSKPVSVPAGANRNRPTVRNRLTSFGSRVPPLNNPSPSASNK